MKKSSIVWNSEWKNFAASYVQKQNILLHRLKFPKQRIGDSNAIYSQGSLSKQ